MLSDRALILNTWVRIHEEGEKNFYNEMFCLTSGRFVIKPQLIKNELIASLKNPATLKIIFLLSQLEIYNPNGVKKFPSVNLNEQI